MSLKKSLVALLVVTMILGSVGTAFAGFSDASGSVAAAADRLGAFGVVTGFEDGTFRPADKVTRGQMAAFVVRSVGLKAAADFAGGTTKFSDVAADHWASGVINVAAEQGLITGYPDGTFKPEANVSYAESITMIVRTLGYAPLVTGAWPANYLAKAAELNLTTGISAASGTNATRGDIAIMTDRSLDKEPMIAGAYDSAGKVTYTKSAKKLAEEKLGVTTVEGVLNDSSTLFTPALTAKVKIDAVEKKLKAGYDPNAFLGQKIKAFLNSDGEVFYAESKTSSTDLKTDMANASALVGAANPYTGTIDLDNASGSADKTYTMAAGGAEVYLNNVKQTGAAPNLAGHSVTLVLDSTGKVTAIVATKPTRDVVKSVTSDGTGVNLRSGAFINTKDAKSVSLTGVAKLSDLQENDGIEYLNSGTGKDSYWKITASRKTAAGTLSTAAQTGTALKDYVLTIGGTTYKVEANAMDKDGAALNDAKITALVGKSVTAVLSARGFVQLLKSDAPAAATNWAFIRTGANNTPVDAAGVRGVVGVNGTQHVVDVKKADGTNASFTIADNAKFYTTAGVETNYDVDAAVNTAPAGLATGDVVTYKLDSNGNLTEVKIKATKAAIDATAPPAAALAKNNDEDLIGGKKMTSSTVFFDMTGAAVTDWKTSTQSAVEGATTINGVVIDDADVAIRAAVVIVKTAGGGLASTTNKAVVVSRAINADSKQVFTLNVNGTVGEYVLDSSTVQSYYTLNDGTLADGGTTATNINAKDVVTFKTNSSGKITEIAEQIMGTVSGTATEVAGAAALTVRIAEIRASEGSVKYDIYASNGTISDTDWVITNSKTQYYNNTGSSPAAAAFADLAVGDSIRFFDTNADGIVDVIVKK